MESKKDFRSIRRKMVGATEVPAFGFPRASPIGLTALRFVSDPLRWFNSSRPPVGNKKWSERLD
jgi:hypothetical protein